MWDIGVDRAIDAPLAPWRNEGLRLFTWLIPACTADIRRGLVDGSLCIFIPIRMCVILVFITYVM
jgi:hypothetical protein